MIIRIVQPVVLDIICERLYSVRNRKHLCFVLVNFFNCRFCGKCRGHSGNRRVKLLLQITVWNYRYFPTETTGYLFQFAEDIFDVLCIVLVSLIPHIADAQTAAN